MDLKNREDNDILARSTIPENPMVDPLALDDDSNLQGYSEEIVILDSSSEEDTFTETKPLLINDFTSNSPSLTRTIMQNKTENNTLPHDKPVELDIIDIDADDTDALAPLRSVMHSIRTSARVNTLTDLEVPSVASSIQGMTQLLNQLPNNIQYSGKMVKILGNSLQNSKNGVGMSATKKHITNTEATTDSTTEYSVRSKVMETEHSQQGVAQHLNSRTEVIMSIPKLSVTSKNLSNDTSENAISFIRDSSNGNISLTTNKAAEKNKLSDGELRMEDIETDIGIQKFVLYKPQYEALSDSTIPQLQQEQPGINIDPSYIVDENPRSISLESLTHSTNRTSAVNNQPFLTPINSNLTGVDLNVNISKASTSPMVSHSKYQEKHKQPNSQYNVELGLVFNVNEAMSEANNQSLSSNKKQIELHNVALDVSVNMNCISKQTAASRAAFSTTVAQNHNTEPAGEIEMKSELDLYSNFSNSVSNFLPSDEKKNSTFYVCSYCQFETADSDIMKSHACAFTKSIKKYFKQHVIHRRTRMARNAKTNKICRKTIYFCSICSFESSSLSIMNKQKCIHPTNASSSPKIRHQKPLSFCCAVCSYKSTNPKIMKSHICSTNNHYYNKQLGKKCKDVGLIDLDKGLQDLGQDTPLERRQVGEIYCCVVCSFKTTTSEAMKSHICSIDTNNISKDFQTEKHHARNVEMARRADFNNKLQNTSIRKLSTQIYCCSICSYKSTNSNAVNSHICTIDKISTNTNIQAPACDINMGQLSIQPVRPNQIYRCARCSWKTTNINVMNTHICPIKEFSIRRQIECQTGEILCCASCSYKTSNPVAINSHICHFSTNVIKNIRTNTVHPEKEQPTIANEQNIEKYLCSRCFYQTTDIEVINSHICPLSTSNCNINTQNPLQIIHKQQAPTSGKSLLRTQLEQHQSLFSCTECSFSSTNMNTTNSHICSNHETTTNSGTPTRRLNIGTLVPQSCYQTTVEEVMNTLKHPLNKLNISEQELLNTPNCIVNVIKEESVKHIQSVQVYYCTNCSYKSTFSEALKKHNCVPDKMDSDKVKRKYMFQCVNCSYASEKFNDINTHKCPKVTKKPRPIGSSVITNEIGNKKELIKKSEIQAPKFSCLSCPFTTADVVLANAHKCRTDSLMYKAGTRLNKNSNYCEMCGYNCLNSSDLFAHVMEAHFSINKFWACTLCSSEILHHFDSATDLRTHYKILHKEPYPDKEEILYKCRFCDHVMEDQVAMKKHFASHICQHGNKIQSVMFQENFVDFFKENRDSTCQYPPMHVNETKTLNSGSYVTYCDEEEAKCYSCKQNILIQGLKCVNSNCENWFHINCCNIYGRQIDPGDITDFPDWFCVQCNDKEVQHVATAQENVETVDLCLNLTDKLLLEEVKNQQSMFNEMKKIKDEELATKAEFRRIKNFIINSKSERINDPQIQGVCDMIEQFINAGLDDANN